EMGFIAFRGIILSEPRPAGRRPFVQVLLRRPLEGVSAFPFPQVEKVIFEASQKLLLGKASHIGRDEGPMEKSYDERSMVRGRQPPCGVDAPERFQGIMFAAEIAHPLNIAPISGGSRLPAAGNGGIGMGYEGDPVRP